MSFSDYIAFNNDGEAATTSTAIAISETSIELAKPLEIKNIKKMCQRRTFSGREK
jgi:hypothetical protein